ncbi:MAG: M14 family metallopeptidase [Bacteroidales bacterium]|nr:M14 family metallopeptidase [Bacteroidales bacterium]
MKNYFLLLMLALNSMVAFSQNNDLTTWFEQTKGMQTPRYKESVDYCIRLASASPKVNYFSFGKSAQGRDLPLLIIDSEGITDPTILANSGKAVLLIQACIHSGESDGKDAGFLLIRDLISKPGLTSLLNHVSILFIPILNVDGHERFGPFNRINQNGPEEMGWRTTAQNLNLNRDYMKADAPEIQAWQRLFDRWNPDMFIDCHVTDGADYQYVLTYALETKGNMEKNLAQWTEESLEPYLTEQMQKAGMPIFPYVEFRRWHDPRSGLVKWTAPPMLSQGYAACRNRPGLLIESHMLKPYKQRVLANYELLKQVIIFMDKEYVQLKKLNREADLYTSSEAFRKEPFGLSWTEVMDDSTMTDFLGFEYSIDTSDLSGGLWFKYDNTKPCTWKLPIFSHNIPESKVNLPEAYLIPPQWTDVIQRLKNHGIRYKTLSRDLDIETSTLRFRNVKWQSRSYEGRIKVNYELSDSTETRIFPEGSVIIEMSQPLAKVIAHLLEPGSPDSYASWGFFNTILEQKEYVESYVMEVEARKMLAASPRLKEEFEQKKLDPKFAANPDAILRWFHSKSPWWDTQFNVYPVGRITEKSTLEEILKYSSD